MPRPQFTLRALLVAMLVVGAFFGGMAVQRAIDERHTLYYKIETDPDGTERVMTVRAIPGEEE